MSRSFPKVRNYTHGGEGRLFQLRQFGKILLQLKQENDGKHDLVIS